MQGRGHLPAARGERTAMGLSRQEVRGVSELESESVSQRFGEAPTERSEGER
jgi:hypothetical protein